MPTINFMVQCSDDEDCGFIGDVDASEVEEITIDTLNNEYLIRTVCPQCGEEIIATFPA